MKARLKRKAEHYSNLKLLLRIATLVIAIWALVVAYQAKQKADWVDMKQNSFIFRDEETH